MKIWEYGQTSSSNALKDGDLHAYLVGEEGFPDARAPR